MGRKSQDATLSENGLVCPKVDSPARDMTQNGVLRGNPALMLERLCAAFVPQEFAKEAVLIDWPIVLQHWSTRGKRYQFGRRSRVLEHETKLLLRRSPRPPLHHVHYGTGGHAPD